MSDLKERILAKMGLKSIPVPSAHRLHRRQRQDYRKGSRRRKGEFRPARSPASRPRSLASGRCWKSCLPRR